MIFNFDFDLDNLGSNVEINSDTGVMEFSEIATVYYFEENSFWDETTCTFFVKFTPEGV